MRAFFYGIGRSVPSTLMLLVFAGLTLFPVLRFLLLPVLGAGSGSAGIAHEASLSLEALVNSVRIGLLATVWAVAVGVAIAWLLEKRRWAPGGLIVLALWILFAMPSYLMTTGWQIFFSTKTLAHSALARLFFSQVGIIFLLGLKGLPFATLAARSSWRAIGSELADAASLHIKGPWRRHTTTLQLLWPAAASAFAIVFIENIQEFGIPATLGAQIHLPIITYAIYERLATTPVDFGGAAVLSWQLVGLAVLAAGLQLYFAARYSSALVHGRQRTAPPRACSFLEAVLAWIGLALLIGLGLLLPCTELVAAALAPIKDAVPASVAWNSLFYSTLYATLAALASVAIAAPMLLRQRTHKGAVSKILGAVALTNMALPGVVLGAAYLIAFNSRLLPLYGTPLLLVMAYVAVQVPMLLRFLQAPVDHVHPNLSEAARLHGMPWSARFLDVEGPLLARPLVWGWMMAFTQIFFELPISELLYPAGRAPVGVALVWLNQALHYTQEARLALAAIGLSLLIAGAAAAAVAYVTPWRLAEEPA